MTDNTSTKKTSISLLAFFPAKLLSMTVYGLTIVTAMLTVLWPWGKETALFILQHKGPSLSLPIFTATAVIVSYIQLRCGRGELTQREQGLLYLPKKFTQERNQIFFRYGMLMLLLHTTFFLLPFLPLLIVSASVSGLSQRSLWLSIGLLWMSALMCRSAGLLLYRLWGEASTLGYLLGRAFFGAFFFLLPIYLSYLGPLRVLYALYKHENFISGDMPVSTAFWLCLGIMFLMTLLMLLAAHVAGARIKQEDTEEP